MGFCQGGVLSCGVLSVWGFVLWGFVLDSCQEDSYTRQIGCIFYSVFLDILLSDISLTLYKHTIQFVIVESIPIRLRESERDNKQIFFGNIELSRNRFL